MLKKLKLNGSEDLQDLLELTHKKDVLFTIGDWNAKVKFKRYLEKQANLALEYKKNQVKEFCQENALVIANTLFQQHEKALHMDITRWSTPKSD